MRSFPKLLGCSVFVLVLGSVAAVNAHAQHDDHGTDTHSSGHSGGGGKGPKYMGGRKGASHSHEGHSGGSSSHKGGTSRAGSKHVEDKIFHGHEDHEGSDPGGHEEG